MNQDLVKFIQYLSEKDNKSLAQKTLKGTEELGELARAILPYENAHATNHRFATKENILEEIADNLLVILSIGFDLGFSYDEIVEMIETKSKKWHSLLVKEERYIDKTPYEIHITVNTDKLEAFRGVCKFLDVKPIILDLQDQLGGHVMTDVMTSSTFIGTNRTAYEEMKRISMGLTNAGFHVVRDKIETVPWHPAAPTQDNPAMPENCYFECHFGILCNDEIKPKLTKLAQDCGAHLSRNMFKKLSETDYKLMMTYRSYHGTSEEFTTQVDLIKQALDDANFEVDKVIIEFSVYDTRVSHDAKWINK